MFEVDNDTIKLTRGDSLVLKLLLKLRTGEVYTPKTGDSIMFGLKSKLNASRTAYIETEPLVKKSISIEDMILALDPGDTKKLPFGNYAYDIEITFANGKVDTPINSAEFKLLSEVI